MTDKNNRDVLLLKIPHDVEQYIWALEKEENIDWLIEQLENENIETDKQPDSTEK